MWKVIACIKINRYEIFLMWILTGKDDSNQQKKIREDFQKLNYPSSHVPCHSSTKVINRKKALLTLKPVNIGVCVRRQVFKEILKLCLNGLRPLKLL